MLRPRKAVLSLLALTVSAVAMGADFKPGEVIVKYKPEVFRVRSEMNELYDTLGVQSIQRFKGMMGGYEHLILGACKDIIMERQNKLRKGG